MKNRNNTVVTLNKGIITGACLIIVGVVLQLSIGPVVWELFAWPVNIMVVGCWWGINYLPSAQATSVHTYNS